MTHKNGLIISAADLKKAVKTAGSVINANAVLDVLTAVMIEVDGKEALFTGTNLDLTLTIVVPVSDATTFSMLIDHKQLSDIASILPEAPVVMGFDVDKLALTIECDGAKYVLGGLEEKEFPTPPQPKKDDKTITLPVAVLDKMKIASAFCSKDTLRPAMTGVMFELRDETIKFVATDAHRLYESEPIALEGGSAPDSSIPWMVIPKSAVERLTSMSIKEDLKFTFNDSHAMFKAKGLELSVRLIDARFPDYNAVKPEHSFWFSTEGNSLRNTVRMVSVAANKTTNQVVLDMQGNNCTLSAQDIDLNTQSKKDLGIISGGDDMKVAVNAALFTEILERVAGEPTVRYSTPTRALVVEGTGNKDYFLIMPLMVGV